MSSLSDARVDVLVVGSGGAGMSAAVSAASAGASVIVTTKSALGAGNTGRAQGGIQAAMGDDDSPESHYEDTFAAGHRAARPELVRALAESGPDAIAWLTEIGVDFTRDERRLRLLRCGGAARKRLLQAGERTGAEMVRALRTAVRASGAEVWESTRLVELAPGGRRLARRRSPRAATAPAARSAPRPSCSPRAAACGARPTRSASAAPTTPTPPPRCCASRSSSAPRGRELDSWQRHPTGSVWPEALAGYALPETTRSYGATLHDADGERFVDELAPRDVVAQAIIDVVEEGRGATAPDGSPGVWLDTAAIDRENGAGFTAAAPRLRPQALHSRPGWTSPASACWSTPCSTTATAASRSTSAPPRRCPASSPRARSPGGSTAPTG